MKYYIVNKHDPSICYGTTTPKEVMHDMKLNNAEFTKFVRNEKLYKGGILVAMEDEEKRYVSSDDTEEWRKIHETKRCNYYVSNKFRVISKFKQSGIETELYPKGRDTSKDRNVRLNKKNAEVPRLVYQGFIDSSITKNDMITCDGDLEIKNLKRIDRKDWKFHERKVKANGVVYKSIAECAKKNYCSQITVRQYLSGKRKNVLGVEYCD